jgi:hypothetical protein
MAAFQFRKRRVRRWWYLGATIMAAAFAAFYIAGAGAVLSGSPSKFEAGDGDQIMTTAGNKDWANVAFTHVVDPITSTDSSFTPGQKQDTVCPDTTGHSNPPKDDFTDVASFSETNNDPQSNQYLHTFLYGATIRDNANGSASENVELKQGHIDPATGQLATCGSGNLLARTVGDKLVAIDYTNGGVSVAFNVLTWIDGTDPNNATCFVANDPLPCWGAKVFTLSSAGAEGLASQGTTSVANDPIGEAVDSSCNVPSPPAACPINSVVKGTTLATGQFAEFGIDLATSGIIPSGSCAAFPQTVWESRSSGSSFVSSTKDIAIENHTITNCGELIIRKHTAPTVGVDNDFKYDSTIPNPTGTVTSSSSPYCTSDNFPNGTYGTGAAPNGFKLNTKNSTAAAPNNSLNTEDCKNLATGTYLVTEETDSNYTLTSITCSVDGSGGSTANVGTVTGGTFSSGANSTFDTGERSIQANLKPGDVITCDYTNTLNQGALVIIKNSTKGGPVLTAGAKFCYSTTTGCTSSGTVVTDLGPSDTIGSTGDQDNTTGKICIAGLAPGDYKINETSAPSGYGASTSGEQTGTVVNGTNCTSSANGANYPTVANSAVFTDPPLSTIDVSVAPVTAGATHSSVVCAKGGTNVPAQTENGQVDSVGITNITTGTTSSTVTLGSALSGVNTGDTLYVQISGSNVVPSATNDYYVATVVNTTHLTIPLSAPVTTAGTNGTLSIFDDTHETFGDGTSGLIPGTYVCTVVIDP